MDAISVVPPLTSPTRRSAGRPAAVRAADPGQRSPGPRRGFTLIEMLTVVVIIGILASLVTGAVIRARVKARVLIIGIEISQLDAALKAHKQKYGAYPPDFSGINKQAAVIRHLENAFPRYRIEGQTTAQKWANLTSSLAARGVDIEQMDPSTALVFWLGGLPDGAGSRRLIGFSANPRDPFDTSASRTTPFEFDPRRLKIVDGALRYYPDIGRSGQNAPYVYFRPRNGDYTGKSWEGTVFPFRDTDTNDWVNPRMFQILSAGLDDKFGTTTPAGEVPEYPGGANYGDDQFDNITNFSGNTLEDKM